MTTALPHVAGRVPYERYRPLVSVAGAVAGSRGTRPTVAGPVGRRFSLGDCRPGPLGPGDSSRRARAVEVQWLDVNGGHLVPAPRRCARRAVRGTPAELAEDRLQHRQHRRGTPRADDDVPQRFQLLPANRIGGMADARHRVVMRSRASCDGAPAIEVAVRPPIAALERLASEARRPEYGVTRVV